MIKGKENLSKQCGFIGIKCISKHIHEEKIVISC